MREEGGRRKGGREEEGKEGEGGGREGNGMEYFNKQRNVGLLVLAHIPGFLLFHA